VNKIAIFVEGQTEQLFVERLLTEIAGQKALLIETCLATGGLTTKRRFLRMKVSGPSSGQAYFALIVDSGADNRVKSDIADNYEGLVRQGFQWIIGIRDVYPQFNYHEIPKLRMGLQYRLKTIPVTVKFALGIMEIETWFISEHSHFVKIHPTLTTQTIQAALNFDPGVDDIQLRPHPAEDLNRIYNLVGFAYNKSRSNVQRTIAVLDYAMVYLELKNRLPDLNTLITSLDEFLA